MGMMGWRESQRDGVERRETETVTDRDRDGGERDTEMGEGERHRDGEGERCRDGVGPRKEEEYYSQAFHNLNNVGKRKKEVLVLREQRGKGTRKEWEVDLET